MTSGGPRLLDPFPRVRLAGRLTARGVVVTRLTVRAPADSRVRIRCTGRGCGSWRMLRYTMTDWRSLRVRRAHRRYRAGDVLEIFVSGQDTIGKYTRFRIRRGKAPGRRDRCVAPEKPGTVPAILPCP